MKKFLFILLVASLAMTGCKEEEEDSVTSETPADIQTAPLVDATTQLANADDAATAAGWTDADFTTLDSSNSGEASSAVTGSTALVSDIANAATTGGLINSIRSIAQSQANLQIKSMVQMIVAGGPQKATTTTIDADGYEVQTQSETYNVSDNCPNSTSGAVTLTGTLNYVLKSKTTSVATAGTYDSHRLFNGSSDLEYSISGCTDFNGTLVYGIGKRTQSDALDATASLTYNTSTYEVIDARSTSTQTSKLKASGGHAIQVRTGEKYKIGYDFDVKLVAAFSRSGYNSTTGSYDNNDGSLHYLFITTLLVDSASYTCTLDQTYTWAQLLDPSWDPDSDMVCSAN